MITKLNAIIGEIFDRNYFYQLETGQATIDLNLLDAYADILDIKVSDILSQIEINNERNWK